MTASRTKPDEPMGAAGDHSSAESAAEAMKNPEEKAPATNDRAIAWTDVPTLPALPRWPIDADGEALRVDSTRDDTPARARAVPPPPPPHAIRPRPAAQASEDVNEEPVGPRTIEHFDLDDVLSRVSSIPPPPPTAGVDVPDAPRAYGALTAPPPAMRGPVPVSRILSYGALAGAVFVGAQMAIGAGLHSLARPSASTIAAAAKPSALALTSAQLRTMQAPTAPREALVTTVDTPSVDAISRLAVEAPSDTPIGYSLDEALGANAIDAQPIDAPPEEAAESASNGFEVSLESAVPADHAASEDTTEADVTGIPPVTSADSVPADVAPSTPALATQTTEELAKAEHAERIRRIRHRRILAIRAARAAGAENGGSLVATPRTHARKPSPSR